MDWTSTIIAAIAAAGVAGREGANFLRPTPQGQVPPEMAENVKDIVEAVAALTALTAGLSQQDVKDALKQIEDTFETVDREDRDNPGQKLVWFPASAGKSVRQLAENVEAQTRILKQLADVVKAVESRTHAMETMLGMFMKMRGD